MRVVVTGASGFVGRVLMQRLNQSGLDVWAVVREDGLFEKEILLDLALSNEEELCEKLIGTDCIIHLAANADFSAGFAKETYKVNCLSNLLIANVCKKIGTHLVFASNALIAGMQQEFIDAATPDNPEIPYNIAKYISEEYITENVKNYCILRIGGIYGYHGPSHLFLNRAIELAIGERRLFNIQNDGLGERNYIYVEDLCSWIIYIVKNRTIGKCLVAGGETLPIKEIFSLLNEVFIDGQATFTLDESLKGRSQVIDVKVPSIEMHSYRMAFNDIKKKLHSL
jgi:nucleoside-diphosphate-sugar epimerase